ncbi:Sterol 3-beta-glucosyltransferase [Gonapodya sp. JEL0774]|nr:Sterol 3-beta-glucosyltransferase [Gonapodya sp. JEL0774]
MHTLKLEISVDGVLQLDLGFLFHFKKARNSIYAELEKLIEKYRAPIASLSPSFVTDDRPADHGDTPDVLELCRFPSQMVDTLAPSDNTVVRALNSEALCSRPVKHVTIFTIGSRGDVQPFVRLGKVLKSQGYNVRIATFTEFQRFVESHGLEFAPVAGDPVTIMAFATEKGMFTPSFLVEGQLILRPWIDDMMLTAYQACRGTDLLIGTPSAMCGVHIAEAYGIPYISAMTMPWHATRYFPHPFFVPNGVKSGRYNLLTHKLTFDGMALGMYMQTNKFRRRIGLAPAPLAGPIRMRDIPTVYCYSPSVLPPPSDWPETAHVAGYFFLDNPDVEFTPPAPLIEFFAKYKGVVPILYIGMGSIVIDDPTNFTRIILEAATRTGIACIVSEGWSGRGKSRPAEMDAITWPEHVMKIGALPHDYLFRQVDGVIHHGGAGTVAAGLRAGKPTAVHPFFGDQDFWGDILERTHLGVRIKKTTVEDFVQAMKLITSDSAMKSNALRIADLIASEDGATAAAAIIERELPLARAQMRTVLEQAAKAKESRRSMSIRISFEAITSSLPRPPSPTQVLEAVTAPVTWIMTSRRGSLPAAEVVEPPKNHNSNDGDISDSLDPIKTHNEDVGAAASLTNEKSAMKKFIGLLRKWTGASVKTHSASDTQGTGIVQENEFQTPQKSYKSPGGSPILQSRARWSWFRNPSSKHHQIAPESTTTLTAQSTLWRSPTSRTVSTSLQRASADDLSEVVQFSEGDDDDGCLHDNDSEQEISRAMEKYQKLYERVRVMTQDEVASC